MKTKEKSNKGFTLIELMIVVVIIGILAALAIPRFMEASKKAKISEAKVILKQIYVAAAAYKEQTGSWPSRSGDGWLNNGWPTVGIDAPSGKPRFAYQWAENSDDLRDDIPGTIIATAYGSASGCPHFFSDASLALVQVRIDNEGIMVVSDDGGENWK